MTLNRTDQLIFIMKMHSTLRQGLNFHALDLFPSTKDQQYINVEQLKLHLPIMS